MAEQAINFVDSSKRRREEFTLVREPLREISLYAASRNEIPLYLDRDKLVLAVDTDELYTGRGYGEEIAKVSDVHVGGSVRDFPIPGVLDKIYIATVDPKGVYVWDAEAFDYKQISNTNDQGDTCFISDIVPMPDREAIEKLAENLGTDDPEKKLHKPREGRLYIDLGKQELYVWRNQITDKDEQDGGRNDLKGNFVKVGVTDDDLRTKFSAYRQQNNEAVVRAQETAEANTEDLRGIHTRIDAAEGNIEDLQRTRATRKELSDAAAKARSESDAVQSHLDDTNAGITAYKQTQAERDAEQNRKMEAHQKESDERKAELDAAIEELKAHLYADITLIETYPVQQVPYDTDIVPLLPKTNTVTLDDGTHYTLEVRWTSGEYSATASPAIGQTVYGELQIPKWMRNTRAFQPHADILVSADPYQDGDVTTHLFILPLMQTEIHDFSKQLGIELSNEDVYGDGYTKDAQTALSTRRFELRLLGATYQTQTVDHLANLVLDEAIDDSIEHVYLPKETYQDGISVPTWTAPLEEQNRAVAELVSCGFCSDSEHPYWNGCYGYDDKTDTLSFRKMGQSTALVYMARKINNGYLPYPYEDKRIGG